MGAEEYELLVSTLNKLATLKKKLTSEREAIGQLRRKISSKESENDKRKKDLKKRDLEVPNIDSNIKKIHREAELDIDIKLAKTDLATEKQQGRIKLKAISKNIKDVEFISIFVSVVFGIFLFYIGLTIFIERPGNRIVTAGIFSFLLYLVIDIHYTIKRGNEKEEIQQARYAREKILIDLQKSKIGQQSKFHKIKADGEKLKSLDKKLKEEKKVIHKMKKAVSTHSMSIESLQKEIEDVQETIAPLIPYSDLLLDDGGDK